MNELTRPANSMANGGFNLKCNSGIRFSLQRSEMFIAMSGKQDLAPLGAKPGRQDGRAGKSDCAPTELQGKERTARL